MTISAALARIYTVAPTGAYYMEALSIYHSALKAPLHMTNASLGFDANVGGHNHAYMESLPFSLKLPTKDTSGSQQLAIAFSNVEQDLISDVEAMAAQPYEPAVCLYRVYIRGQIDGEQHHIQQLNPPWRYDINAFVVTGDTITAAAQKSNMHNSGFPKVVYNATNYPGLKK